ANATLADRLAPLLRLLGGPNRRGGLFGRDLDGRRRERTELGVQRDSIPTEGRRDLHRMMSSEGEVELHTLAELGRIELLLGRRGPEETLAEPDLRSRRFGREDDLRRSDGGRRLRLLGRRRLLHQRDAPPDGPRRDERRDEDSDPRTRSALLVLGGFIEV